MSHAQTTVPSDTPGTKQWIRKCSLIAADEKGKGIELGDMRIVFEVTAVTSITPATLDAKIYNLSKDTSKRLLALPHIPTGQSIGPGPSTRTTPAGRVTLQAGYEGNFGIIFQGEIVQVRDGRETSVDTILDIFAGDGDWSHAWAILNTSLASGWSAHDVNKQLRSAYEVYGVTGADLPPTMPGIEARAPRGKVCFGMAHEIAESFGRARQTDCFVNHGKLEWVPMSAYKPGEVVVLKSTTGMMGMPQQTNFGVAVLCLLNPSIGRGTLVHIDNKSIQRERFSATIGEAEANPVLAGNLSAEWDGVYKVIAVRHFGDTWGNDWYTEIQAMAMSQTGKDLPDGQRFATMPPEYNYGF